MKKSNKKLFGYNTNKEDLYKVYLSTINGILKLTSKELSVASRMYSTLEEISKGVTDTKIQNELLFSVAYKKKMREELGGMSALLMNNYISALKDKKIIVEKDGTKMMNEALRIDTDSKHIEIKFNFKVN
jgi:hypothetical protein